MMRHKIYLTASVLAFGFLTSAPAQETTLTGPTSGVIFDRASGTLRPIHGIPGASYVADAVCEGLQYASVAPSGAKALGVREGRLALITGLNTGAPFESSIEGAAEKIDRIAWNSLSTAAVLYSSSSGRAQLWRAGENVAELGTLLSATALQLDNAGTSAAATVAGTEESGIYVMKAGETPRLLARVQGASSLALANSGRDLLFADREAGEILEARGFAADSGVALFAKLNQPVGLTVSEDGKAVLAVTAEKALAVFDLATRAPVLSRELETQPTTLNRLSRSLYLLNADAKAGEALQVLDGSQDFRVYFVPAARAGK